MEPRRGTAWTVSVSASATISGDLDSVHDLERAILEATHAAGRYLYTRAFAAGQEAWRAAHPNRFTAQRGRTLHGLTPFEEVRLPVRGVRQKASSRYLTFSQVLWRHQATRRLSPAVEQQACAAATEQNYCDVTKEAFPCQPPRPRISRPFENEEEEASDKGRIVKNR